MPALCLANALCSWGRAGTGAETLAAVAVAALHRDVPAVAIDAAEAHRDPPRRVARVDNGHTMPVTLHDAHTPAATEGAHVTQAARHASPDRRAADRARRLHGPRHDGRVRRGREQELRRMLRVVHDQVAP